jgi:hypothetical protein
MDTPLADLSIFQATRAQTLEARRRGHAQWGAGWTSVDGFLQLYAHFEQHISTRGLGDIVTTWYVRAPASRASWLSIPPGSSRRARIRRHSTFSAPAKRTRPARPLAPPSDARPSYPRQAVIYEPAPDAVRRAPAHAIGCVLTPPAARGHGHAAHMMRLLHWALAPQAHAFPPAWGAPPARTGASAASVLYSGIGAEFYARCGAGEAHEGGWALAGPVWSTLPAAAAGKDEAEWEVLDLARAEEVWEEDAALMEADVVRAGRASGKAALALLPSHSVAAFQAYRGMDPASGALQSDVWGVRLRDDPAAPLTMATWAYPKSGLPKTLAITRLRAPDARRCELLLRKACALAAGMGLEHVQVWNVPTEFEDVVTTLGGRTVERTDTMLPQIMSYVGEEVEWLFNERCAARSQCSALYTNVRLRYGLC